MTSFFKPIPDSLPEVIYGFRVSAQELGFQKRVASLSYFTSIFFQIYLYCTCTSPYLLIGFALLFHCERVSCLLDFGLSNKHPWCFCVFFSHLDVRPVGLTDKGKEELERTMMIGRGWSLSSMTGEGR